MSFAFYAFAMLVVANPFRWRLSLPEDDGRVRPRPLVVGVALLAVVAVAFGLWAGDALDWLDISPESWRIAAGIIAIGAGLWVMARPQRREEPSLSGDLAGLVPVFFPVLLSPELYVLLKSTGADESVGFTLAALAFPVVGLAGLALVKRTPPSETAMVGLSRLFGALAVVVGIALVISGIRDV